MENESDTLSTKERSLVYLRQLRFESRQKRMAEWRGRSFDGILDEINRLSTLPVNRESIHKIRGIVEGPLDSRTIEELLQIGIINNILYIGCSLLCGDPIFEEVLDIIIAVTYNSSEITYAITKTQLACLLARIGHAFCQPAIDLKITLILYNIVIDSEESEEYFHSANFISVLNEVTDRCAHYGNEGFAVCKQIAAITLSLSRIVGVAFSVNIINLFGRLLESQMESQLRKYILLATARLAKSIPSLCSHYPNWNTVLSIQAKHPNTHIATIKLAKALLPLLNENSLPTIGLLFKLNVDVPSRAIFAAKLLSAATLCFGSKITLCNLDLNKIENIALRRTLGAHKSSNEWLCVFANLSKYLNILTRNVLLTIIDRATATDNQQVMLAILRAATLFLNDRWRNGNVELLDAKICAKLTDMQLRLNSPFNLNSFEC